MIRSSFIQYQMKSYLRSLTFIPPVTLFGAWVIIFYTYSGVPIMSSYVITSVSMYLVMTWVAMNVFSLEDETEKNLLIVQLNGKRAYLIGKWAVCFLVTAVLGAFALVYPLVFSIFKEPIQPVQLMAAIYGHIICGFFGVLVGSFFSTLKIESKRFAWLSAMFVIVISLAAEGIVEKASFFKWLLLPFPPIYQVILHFTDGTPYVVGNGFWLDTLWVMVYVVAGFFLTKKLFLKRE
ncbi:hypothetical protein NCCP2222_09720 [Sporosarcina sp. NCCP-2222]|uniref:hypothetical protein n=1 Tax=Sporosarcina sp. NCCP-2222 TaxID=2935073 RepID=UPI002083A7AD|nr:hypothetical protein [Sporosarcina sp. NCCP-2222]GKV55025.1 hypothetical protein NCCP2222_09720 [Sporosarcina sp. NCCP-2222]